jgi:predicted nucleotidyltransferase
MYDDIIEQFLKDISSIDSKIKEMFLFGSRSREDWKPDSDYDILIVLEKKEREIISKLYDAVIDILLSSGKLISLKIFSESEYIRLKSIPTPFMSNVLNEGRRIGFNN